MCRSVPQMEAVFTRTSTSVGQSPGTGDGIHLQASGRLHLAQRLHRPGHLPGLSFNGQISMLAHRFFARAFLRRSSPGGSAAAPFPNVRRFNVQRLGGVTSPAPPRQSSPQPADTPPPIRAAPAHTPPKRRRVSSAYPACHRQIQHLIGVLLPGSPQSLITQELRGRHSRGPSMLFKIVIPNTSSGPFGVEVRANTSSPGSGCWHASEFRRSGSGSSEKGLERFIGTSDVIGEDLIHTCFFRLAKVSNPAEHPGRKPRTSDFRRQCKVGRGILRV